MAKAPAGRNGTSRIRFVMIEAEMAEGDLDKITLAIQNAIKPSQASVVRGYTTGEQKTLSASPRAEVADGQSIEDNDDIKEHDDDVVGEVIPQPRQAKPRKYASPKVLEIDLDGDPSWAQYAEQKAPNSDTDRFLTAATWFKEVKGEPTITANHVYTCYRAVGWSAAIEDFSWPLRSLKKMQLMTSAGRGMYAINHLGVAKVLKLPN